ncbi:MAG: phosphopantetheine-binding protein [Fluviibacter sp.]
MTANLVTEEFRSEIARDIIQALNLDVSPSEIAADAPLYGDGLGLDSIDILEIALVVSKKFGFQIKADNPDNASIFKSLNSLCDYILANRTK